MDKAYTEQDYQKDIGFLRACFLRENDNAMGKLEVLMAGRGSDALYVGHEAVPKFLAMKTAYNILENEAFLVKIIMGHQDTKNMPGGELKQWRDECLGLIVRRVETLFNQRHRGALRRIQHYEKRLFEPYFRELRDAVRKNDAGRVYDAVERIGMMSEGFSAEHPIIRRYERLMPSIEAVLNSWDPSHN